MNNIYPIIFPYLIPSTNIILTMHKSTPLFLLLLLSLTTSVINNTIDIIHDYRYSGPIHHHHTSI